MQGCYSEKRICSHSCGPQRCLFWPPSAQPAQTPPYSATCPARMRCCAAAPMPRSPPAQGLQLTWLTCCKALMCRSHMHPGPAVNASELQGQSSTRACHEILATSNVIRQSLVRAWPPAADHRPMFRLILRGAATEGPYPGAAANLSKGLGVGLSREVRRHAQALAGERCQVISARCIVLILKSAQVHLLARQPQRCLPPLSQPA